MYEDVCIFIILILILILTQTFKLTQILTKFNTACTELWSRHFPTTLRTDLHIAQTLALNLAHSLT